MRGLGMVRWASIAWSIPGLPGVRGPPFKVFFPMVRPVLLAALHLGLLLTISVPAKAEEGQSNSQFLAEKAVGILRRNCWRCHGEKNREGGIRLDTASAFEQIGDSGLPVVSLHGNAALTPERSLLMQRVSGDEIIGEQMPPDSSPLSPEDLDVLRRWIELRLPWPQSLANKSDHWAYRPITRIAPPATSNTLASPIDAFVDVERIRQGLSPNPRADREKLLRRLALVVTGLPPTPDLRDRFLNDTAPNAYEKLLDQLLASPKFGEKWAIGWMDLARYADSNGFQADQIRDNWAYRDWLIDAFNEDLPFDQFVIKQLAGDLLPNASLDDRIATGFHRMTPCNVEAGVHPESNRVNQVVDRVNTTATVFLATTLECAQCHDHKYDPFTQKDYYQLFAYFNNTPLEVKQTAGVTWDFYGPTMELPLSNDQVQQREALLSNIASVKAFIQEQQANKNAESESIVVDAQTRLKELETKLAAIKPVTTLVMEEMPTPRETFVLKRGDYEQQADRVFPAPPQALSNTGNENNQATRLDLAHWIASPTNPLAARVAVNRWWAQIFGRGIVSTLEDFGTQSEPPTHPELLDWLASELIASGWSRKHVLRLILLSDTFCQDAKFTEAQRSQDPDNRWLSRGPRFRLPAETIRDSALAISGLLSPKMYGPPIMPYQPPDLWRSVGRNQPKWIAATDEDRFRRGIYVVFKRAAPYPSFVNFDTPDRGSCTVQRPVTNTPLQALNLLNDPAFAEMSIGLAARVLSKTDLDDEGKIECLFQLTLGRSPSNSEATILRTLLEEERQTLSATPKLVSQRTTKAITLLHLSNQDPLALASWSALASVLLNLDETLNY